MKAGVDPNELNHFYNAGFGWICRQCESNSQRQQDSHQHSRIFREGEAESKTPTMANASLAKWMDKERRFLICPRCGVTEDTFIR